MAENQIGAIVIAAAVAVHRELGPGLLETVHEVILARETAEYFRQMAEKTGISCQTSINLYLRDCAQQQRKLEMQWAT